MMPQKYYFFGAVLAVLACVCDGEISSSLECLHAPCLRSDNYEDTLADLRQRVSFLEHTLLPSSCLNIYHSNRDLGNGYYTIYSQKTDGQYVSREVYCDMARGGYQRVLNFTFDGTNCPESFIPLNDRPFSIINFNCCISLYPGCRTMGVVAAPFDVQSVAGKVVGIGLNTTDGFNTPYRTIELSYVDGVSITFGAPGARQHLFSYASGFISGNVSGYSGSGRAGSCPCDWFNGTAPPDFVGTDYYCDCNRIYTTVSDGVHDNCSKVLWQSDTCIDGGGTCCSMETGSGPMPYFQRPAAVPKGTPLEIRVCHNSESFDEAVGIVDFELFVREI